MGVSRLLIAAMCLAALAAIAAPTPAYLSELPTPARILAEVKGQSPEDTLGDPTYAPRSDTRAYGALAPRGAGKARS